MASRKRDRIEDIPSSSTSAPPSVTAGQDAAPPEPTPVQVDPEPAAPQSPVVNPALSLELEMKQLTPPASPVGGITDLSDSSSGEAVALTDSPDLMFHGVQEGLC
ncbi:hypothetical protein JHK84_044955 [Glycine max]|nr:hypothetical protein JHK86_044844 [Glycine max]KAG5108048.1 hypothetical protein JHK84_044955 [Glycine max]